LPKYAALVAAAVQMNEHPLVIQSWIRENFHESWIMWLSSPCKARNWTQNRPEVCCAQQYFNRVL
jgi:hypothetical protein